MASIYGGASGNGWKLRLDYTVTQDRVANTSSLRLRLYLYANTTGSYNLEKDSAYYVLQGQKVYQTYQYTAPGWYLLGERTVTVRHGADGNGSVQLGGQWVSDVESSWTPASLSVSAAVALPRILRPSVLRAAELTLGQACVLSIRAEEERYTHRVTYALGGASGTVVQETAQRELTWTPPLELARQLPRSVAGTMRLTVTTYDGDTTMGSSVTECRVYVPDTVRPTAALTVTPVNDNAVLEQWGVFVKGMTRLRWQVTAQGAYGSSIDGCSVSCGGVGGSGLNGVSAGAVSVSGEVTAAAVVKDSRGRSVSVEAGSVTVYEYSGPTMTRPAVCRCDADGTVCSDGGYVKVKCGAQCSDVGGRNQVSLRVRSRRPGGEFGGYTALESGVEKVLPGFSPLLSYELELSAEDLPGSRRTVVCAIPTAAAAVHLASGGTAVGVGKYAEHERAVEVNPEWEVYVKGKPLWELIYPVGSLYLSAVDTDPGVLFGGTWERIRDRFLLAAGTAYGAGTTGGEPEPIEVPAVEEEPAPEPEDLLPQVVSPLDGTTVTVFSTTELMYDETMADWRTHNGLDIQAAEGDAVKTAASGMVVSIKSDELMGTTVVIEHAGGYTTQYSCLQAEPPVTEGQQVAAGDIIGLVGSTAAAESSMGPHLHFSVAKDGVIIDPSEYIG